MEKGKLGLRLCFYSVLAFILAFLGYSTLLFLLAGVVLLVEKDEFTTRQVIQAFCLCIVGSLINSVLDILDFFYKVPILGGFWGTILSIISGVIHLIVFIFCLIGIINTAKGKDANVPLASNFANWAYGIIAPKVAPQQTYQQAPNGGQFYQNAPQQNAYTAQTPVQMPQQGQTYAAANTAAQAPNPAGTPDAAAQQANQSQQ